MRELDERRDGLPARSSRVRRMVTVTIAGLGVVLGSMSLAAAQDQAEPGTDAIAGIRVLAGLGGSRIGLTVVDLESSDAAGRVEEGAYVETVRDGGAAQTAGFASGDVVVEFDGERVRSARQLSRLVEETPAGRSVNATVLRDGSRLVLNVIPQAGAEWRPSVGERAQRPSPIPERFRRRDLRGLPGRVLDPNWPGLRRRASLGIQAQALDGQLADFFGVEAGVLVVSVNEESVAASAGLRAGDVITAIGGEAVEDVPALRRRLAEVERGAVFAIDVTRGRASLTLQGRFAVRPPRWRQVPI